MDLGALGGAPFGGRHAIGLAELSGEMLGRRKAERSGDLSDAVTCFGEKPLGGFESAFGKIGIRRQTQYLAE